MQFNLGVDQLAKNMLIRTWDGVKSVSYTHLVTGGTKNYGISSNAALLAPAFINTKAKLLTFGRKKLQKINYTFAYTCNADRCGRLWKAAELKC